MRTALCLLVLALPKIALAQEQPASSPQPAAESQAAPEVVAPVPASPPADVAPAPKPDWRFTGTIGVISLPRVLNLEVLARYRDKKDPKWDRFAIGAGFEYLPEGLVEFGGPKLQWLVAGVEGRYTIWHYVFAGARLGYQVTRADSNKFGSDTINTDKSFVIEPKAGILYTFENGLTIGGELGATIPLFPSSRHEPEDATDANARVAAKTFGEFVMPLLTAFRIGWTLN